MKDQKNQTIRILVGVIAVLILVLIYFFLVQPQYTKFVEDRQLEGYSAGYYQAIIEILGAIQQEGYVAIPVGENQSIILAPVVQ